MSLADCHFQVQVHWHAATTAKPSGPPNGCLLGAMLGFCFFASMGLANNQVCLQAYWQSAIAAKPSASYKGYLLGAVLWFCIPFTLATSLGLGCAALDLPVTVSESAQGLVPPAVAYHLLGSGGAIILTIMLFMAVTSAGSAEMIAVSSIISYDIYRSGKTPPPPPPPPPPPRPPSATQAGPPPTRR